MAKKRGRKKRQNVARERNGRVQRPSTRKVELVKGNDRAEAMKVLYGTNGSDAIGRAFESGLLGDGSDAKAMLDTARRISGAYWANYATGRFKSPIADKTFGSIPSISAEDARRREDWLKESLTAINRMGWPQRRAFDELVIDPFPDFGPHWLELLIVTTRQRSGFIEPSAANKLDLALEALSELAGVEKPRVARLKAA